MLALGSQRRRRSVRRPLLDRAPVRLCCSACSPRSSRLHPARTARPDRAVGRDVGAHLAAGRRHRGDRAGRHRRPDRGFQPVRDRRFLPGIAGRRVPGAAVGVRRRDGRHPGARPRRGRQGGGHLAGPVHRHLHAGPQGVVVGRHPDHRGGLLLSAGPVGGPARHRRPGRIPADQPDPLAGRRQDRSRSSSPSRSRTGRRCSRRCCPVTS